MIAERDKRREITASKLPPQACVFDSVLKDIPSLAIGNRRLLNTQSHFFEGVNIM
jgi:hypothetical protein